MAKHFSKKYGNKDELSITLYLQSHVSVVCQINCVGGIMWIKHAHAQSQYWAVKSDQ